MLDIRETSDYQEKSIFRTEYFQKLLSWKGKRVIKVITGIKRSGKSIVLKEFCQELSKSVDYGQITFLNFEQIENEDLQEYHALYNYIKDRIIPEK